MTTRRLYQHIAARIQAAENCRATIERDLNQDMTHHKQWYDRHRAAIFALVKEYLPSGSGIDCGTIFLAGDSTPEKLVFQVDFHHMDEAGGYAGWTQHKVTVRASLAHGIEISISGPDRNQIKEYLGDLYHAALTAEIDDSLVQALAA